MISVTHKNASSAFPHVLASEDSDTDHMYDVFYAELRRIATCMMRGERLDHTLSATALVNESYIRLFKHAQGDAAWQSKGHFIAAAVETMRRVLIDRARALAAAKRNPQRSRISIDATSLACFENWDWLLDLNEGLNDLSKLDPAAASVLQLYLFAGMPVAEAGRALGLSRWNTYQAWDFAVAFFGAREEVHR